MFTVLLTTEEWKDKNTCLRAVAYSFGMQWTYELKNWWDVCQTHFSYHSSMGFNRMNLGWTL